MTGLQASNLPPLSSDFRGRIGVFGAAGERWLDNLPATVAACARRWQLTVGPPLDNLSYNFVAPATNGAGQEFMLKLGVPGLELEQELAALRAYDGHGSVRLIDADAAGGALLLERLRPGRMLADMGPQGDEEATRIAARLMKRLWRPAPESAPFTTVTRWSLGFGRLRAAFQGGTGPFPEDLVSDAEAIYAQYLATGPQPVLLHGDLHHYNILSAKREPWLAIDPKGLVGEPAYEAGALLRNPFPDLIQWPNPAAIQSKRLDILSQELAIDRRRLRNWALAQAVLSAWWGYEAEGIVDETWLHIADSLREAWG
jgi:streptomycin 6-kinase